MAFAILTKIRIYTSSHIPGFVLKLAPILQILFRYQIRTRIRTRIRHCTPDGLDLDLGLNPKPLIWNWTWTRNPTLNWTQIDIYPDLNYESDSDLNLDLINVPNWS